MPDVRKMAPTPLPKPQPRSIPSLDGMRGVAVLLVVAAHCDIPQRAATKLFQHGLRAAATLINLDGGDLGVSVFFVISGFLITSLLTRRSGAPSLRTFYIRRFFRIFPPYFVYLLVVGLLWVAGTMPMLRSAFVAALLYLSNYFPYIWSEPAGRGWLVGHTWSLSLEEQFYLVWPFLLVRLGHRRAIWIGVALILSSPILRMLTLHFAPWTLTNGQIDRMFHTRIDTIMCGCILALLEDWPRPYQLLMKGMRKPLSAAFVLALLWMVLWESKRQFTFMQIGGIGLEALLLAYLMFYAVQNASSWSGRILNAAWLRHIGLISYSLYLWQQLFSGASMLIHLPIVVRFVLILCCAEASYFGVEKTSSSLRDRYLARQIERAARRTAQQALSQ